MKTLASYRLIGGEGLTAQAVTDRLGLAPSRSHEIGNHVSSRSSTRWKWSRWSLSSAPKIEEGVELCEQIERLLNVLLPVESVLWELVHDGYVADWFCFVASHAAEHAVELDRSLLTRLLKLPGDLMIDACGDQVDCPDHPAPITSVPTKTESPIN